MGRVDSIIKELYEAILAPWKLEIVFGRINQIFYCSHCRIIVRDIELGKISIDHVVDNKGRESCAEFPADIIEKNLLIDKKPVAHLSIQTGHSIYLSEDGHMLLSDAGPRNNKHIMVFFRRARQAPAFVHDDYQPLSTIAGHIIHVLSMIKQYQMLRLSSLACENGLDALNSGVLLLDDANRVLYANGHIERFFKPGGALFSRQDGMHPASAEERNRVLNALDSVRRNARPQGLSIAYRHPGGQEIYRAILNIAQVPAESEPCTGDESSLGIAAAFGARLQVQITCHDEQESVTPAQLGQIFGLTQAEGRLAHALSSGLSVDEFASESRISVSTARTQLRNVLLKTGQNRQQDLVRLLARIPLQEP
jgi:DNA-binding CsgD family transcriptional regulator